MEEVFEQYTKQVSQGTQVDLKTTPYDNPRFALESNLQADAARFATFREAQRERELKEAKTDLDKRKVEARYKEYLATEKQTIFANATAAEAWMGFQENADLYPNLEYSTAGDSDVRPEHAKLDGIILPISDPFWSGHTPPLGFGCRCMLVQTDAPANNSQERFKGYEETPAPKGFDFNPGVEQRLFSDNAGYYTNAPKAEVPKLNDQALGFAHSRSREQALKAFGTKTKQANVPELGKLSISRSDVEQAISTTAHSNPVLRNNLILQLSKVLKEATPIKKVGQKHYYQVKGIDDMILVFTETDSQISLTEIIDKIN